MTYAEVALVSKIWNTHPANLSDLPGIRSQSKMCFDLIAVSTLLCMSALRFSQLCNIRFTGCIAHIQIYTKT